MKMNVQAEPGKPDYVAVEQFVVENHPDDSMSGTCVKCEPKDNQPVREVGYPPFHPNCVCTVEWKEV